MPALALAWPREADFEEVTCAVPREGTVAVYRSTLTLQPSMGPEACQVTGRIGCPTVQMLAAGGEVTVILRGMRVGGGVGVRVGVGVPEPVGVPVPVGVVETEALGVVDADTVLEALMLALGVVEAEPVGLAEAAGVTVGVPEVVMVVLGGKKRGRRWFGRG